MPKHLKIFLQCWISLEIINSAFSLFSLSAPAASFAGRHFVDFLPKCWGTSRRSHQQQLNILKRRGENNKNAKSEEKNSNIPLLKTFIRRGGWVMEECGRLSKSSPHMFDKAHQLMWVLSTKERTAKLIPFPSYIYFLIIFTRSLFARSPWPKLNSMFTLMLVACRLVIVLSFAARRGTQNFRCW